MEGIAKRKEMERRLQEAKRNGREMEGNGREMKQGTHVRFKPRFRLDHFDFIVIFSRVLFVPFLFLCIGPIHVMFRSLPFRAFLVHFSFASHFLFNDFPLSLPFLVLSMSI